eukprot:6202169-Pleurochrysis_carterae.AAC.1
MAVESAASAAVGMCETGASNDLIRSSLGLSQRRDGLSLQPTARPLTSDGLQSLAGNGAAYTCSGRHKGYEAGGEGRETLTLKTLSRRTPDDAAGVDDEASEAPIRVLIRVRPAIHLPEMQAGSAHLQVCEGGVIRIQRGRQNVAARFDAVMGGDVTQAGVYAQSEDAPNARVYGDLCKGCRRFAHLFAHAGLQPGILSSELVHAMSVYLKTPHSLILPIAQVQPAVDAVLSGLNSTVLTYGQTGSGKTHTLFGGLTPDDRASANVDLDGIVARTLQQLFERSAMLATHGRRLALSCTFLEVYNEVLSDLLAPLAAAGWGDGGADSTGGAEGNGGGGG